MTTALLPTVRRRAQGSGRSERAGNSGDMKQITEMRRAKVMDALKRENQDFYVYLGFCGQPAVEELVI